MPGQWSHSDRAQRLPTDWPTTCKRILARDKRICHICLQPGADEVDHIEHGDDHSEANLGAIHGDPCHRVKSAAEGVEARRARAALRHRPIEPHPGDVA